MILTSREFGKMINIAILKLDVLFSSISVVNTHVASEMIDYSHSWLEHHTELNSMLWNIDFMENLFHMATWKLRTISC
jgi:hypothetical protein